MYVSNIRYKQYASASCTRSTNPQGVYTLRYPRFVERVYSWRSGQSIKSNDPSRITSQFMGVRPPRPGSLADRARYINELAQVSFPPENPSSTRVSTVDGGYEFSSQKYLYTPPLLNHSQSASSIYQTVNMPIGYFSPADNTLLPAMIVEASPFPLLGAGGRTAMINDMFAAIAPGRPTADLLVTVVELLRGDIPSIVKNFNKILRNAESASQLGKYIGSEYLNVQFGWIPLLTDIRNVINTLLKLDRLTYLESTRRKRRWDGPSSVTSADRTLTAPTQQQPIRDMGVRVDSNFVNGYGAECSVETLLHEDYQLTSKLSSLARPNSRTNGFAERGEEILKQIGFIDHPTALWDLIPWSFLVDWVTSIGSSLVNAQTYSNGHYSVNYAYFTTKSTNARNISVLRPITFQSYQHASVAKAKGYVSSTSLSRIRATPFGFGVRSLDQLSAYQWSILVALGLAKSR